MIVNYLFLFIGFILVPLLLLKKNRHIASLLMLPFFGFIFFAIYLNKQNQDYSAYVYFFDDPDTHVEIGYSYLIKLLKLLGAETHQSVLAVLATLVVFTFYRIFRISHKWPFFVLIYLMFLFPIDIVQIRNTFAVFLSINSFLFYFQKKYFLFIIFAALAISMHIFSIAFIAIFITSLLVKRKNGGKVIVFLGLVFSLVVFFIVSSGVTAEIRTLEHYISDGKFSSVFVWGGVVFAYVLFYTYFVKKFILDNPEVPADIVRYSQFFYKMICASLVFAPGLYFLYEFNRLYRFVFLMILILSSIVFDYLSIRTRILSYAFLLTMSFAYGLYYSSILNFDWILFGWL